MSISDISGSRTLHRLVYASRQCIAPADLDHEVGAIIRASIRNNRTVSITGLLLIHEGWFLQALEGPAEAVMTTYGRIVRDPRHEAAKLLAVGPASERAFGDWNMCARGMSPADEAIVRTLSKREAFAPDGFSGAAALKLLKAVRSIQHRTERSALA
jgi:hypothetical protein